MKADRVTVYILGGDVIVGIDVHIRVEELDVVAESRVFIKN